ncbi:MAG TPA: AcrB/AcrD/AcrF family protein [Candidatus Latescibacteria bacterium]|nr:AcrB/AcrD/AcrF family protein [Candidatus Latescibacterota bacterium]
MHALARFSVRYPTTVLMLILAILLLGYISFQRLGMDLFPDLNNPRLFVEITAGERPPEEMERQFVDRVEATAARGRGVVNVASIAETGRALVTVEYGWQTDMDEAFLDLQKSVADMSQRSDADEVVVSQHDPNAQPVVVAAFYHPQIEDLDALRQTAQNIIRTELIRLPGVAAVELVGERRREVEVLADPYRLEAYGLTAERLAASIQAANRNMSGGSIVEMGRRYVIKGVGEFVSVDELGDLIVAQKTPALGGGAPGSESVADRIPVYLREVAELRLVLSEADNVIRLDGRRCLGLEIYKEARFNTIDAATSIHEQLDLLRRELPGYRIEVVQDQARFIEAAVTEVEETGLIGILLAVLVLFLFLRRLGVTVVISLAIPISIVATFNLMYFGDLSLNLMTLGGLALGAGMLVDNAIIVVENIFRKLEDGATLTEAAIAGTGEVGGAITSSTLTTIVVFLPIVYLHGAAGELFREQAWTVAFSLLSSLFVALVVIPMLCSRLLRGKAPAHTVHFPRYAALIQALLQRRLIVIGTSALLVVGTVALLPTIGSEFMPRAGQGQLSIELSLPQGTHLDRTEGVVRNLEAFLQQNFDAAIKHLYARVGRTRANAGAAEVLTDEHNAVIHVMLKPDAGLDAADLVEPLGRELAGLPDVEAQFALQETALETSLGRTSAPLLVEIKGRDLTVLSGLAEEVAQLLTGLSTLSNVETGIGAGRPQIEVIVDRTRAAQHSLTVDAMGAQLEAILSGLDAGQLQQRGEYSDIVIRRPRLSLDELAGALLDGADGRRVRLDEVATLKASESPRAISRNNRMRVMTVSAHLSGDRAFDQVAAQVQAELATLDLPPEYNFAITGEEKLRQESFENLRFALILAVVLVYMVMAAQFESLIHPLVILLTIPLAGVGAVLLLLVLGMPLNVMSFIGIIMLAGIAVNDSIILVDRINQNRRAGQALATAIEAAAQSRIRPIIMTSATTMLALLPLAIGFGEGANLRTPMAVAVIGGLVTSTALTLVVIPCFYHLLARLDRLR